MAGRSFRDISAHAQGAARVDDPTTADLALLYVSRWQSAQSAERFAHLYATAVGQRYQKAVTQATESCGGTECPASAVEVLTEEGPVIVERWADNTVLVSESFDATTAAKLSHAVRQGEPTRQAESRQPEELSLRLCELPEFARFSASDRRQNTGGSRKTVQAALSADGASNPLGPSTCPCDTCRA